jgi:hypothetical protein
MDSNVFIFKTNFRIAAVRPRPKVQPAIIRRYQMMIHQIRPYLAIFCVQPNHAHLCVWEVGSVLLDNFRAKITEKSELLKKILTTVKNLNTTFNIRDCYYYLNKNRTAPHMSSWEVRLRSRERSSIQVTRGGCTLARVAVSSRF